MRLLAKLDAIFDRVIGSLAFLGGVLIVLMMLSISYEVISRYFFGHTEIWMVEFNEYALLFVLFLGSAWVLKREGHVSMDLVLIQLNPRGRALLNGLTSILGTLACMILTWYAGETTWGHFQKGVLVVRVLGVPKAPLLAIVCIGSFTLSIQFLRRSYKFLRNSRTLPQNEAEPVKTKIREEG